MCVHKKDSTKLQLTPPGGLEPPTFWLTAKRASRLRHGGSLKDELCCVVLVSIATVTICEIVIFIMCVCYMR